jgi:hypothetical protein
MIGFFMQGIFFDKYTDFQHFRANGGVGAKAADCRVTPPVKATGSFSLLEKVHAKRNFFPVSS